MEDSRSKDGQAGGYGELLAQVRRLTAIVLDMLEESAENRTMEDREKTLLAGTASKLFRFWRTTMKEAESKHVLAPSQTDDSQRSTD